MWPVLLQLPIPYSKNAGVGEMAPQTAIFCVGSSTEMALRFLNNALWTRLGGNAGVGLLVLASLFPFWRNNTFGICLLSVA